MTHRALVRGRVADGRQDLRGWAGCQVGLSRHIGLQTASQRFPQGGLTNMAVQGEGSPRAERPHGQGGGPPQLEQQSFWIMPQWTN